MGILERAIAIAAEAHAGQTDKGGAPYILHPLRVMMAVETQDQRIAAVLHDVVEDCPEWPLERLKAAGFSPAIIEAIDALTRRKGETYDAFIERAAKNDIAVHVKLADINDNRDLSRIAEPTQRDHDRTEKYNRVFDAISALRTKP